MEIRWAMPAQVQILFVAISINYSYDVRVESGGLGSVHARKLALMPRHADRLELAVGASDLWQLPRASWNGSVFHTRGASIPDPAQILWMFHQGHHAEPAALSILGCPHRANGEVDKLVATLRPPPLVPQEVREAPRVPSGPARGWSVLVGPIGATP